MKNTLIDLHNHLICQMERLNDDDLKGDELKAEVDRSKAMNVIAGQIINNAQIQLREVELSCEYNLKKGKWGCIYFDTLWGDNN